MVKRLLSVLIGTIAFGIVAAAQTESQHLEFEAFDAIVVDDEFDVTFRESRNYMVDYTVDAAFESNRLVEVYVRGKTLFISLNRKGMSSDLKKAYRGRNAGKAVLRAVVYAPTVASVQLLGKSLFDAAGIEIKGSRFTVNVSDNAHLSGLSVKTEELTVEMAKSAEVSLKADVDNLIIRTNGNAVLTVNYSAEKVDLTATGSSKTTLTGDAVFAAVHAKGNPDVSMSGKGDILRIDGNGTTDFDGVNFAVKEVTTDMSGSSKAYVSPTEKLNLTLRGGHVVFGGEPSVNIVSIKSASVTRLADEKVRK